MTNNITLSKAFRIRSTLKQKLETLLEEFDDAPKSWEKDTKPDYQSTGGVPTEQIVNKIFLVMKVVKDFTLCIQTANEKEASKIITMINNSKDYVRFVKRVGNILKKTQTSITKENKVTGEETVIEYKLFDNIANYTNAELAMQQHIFELEEQLSVINATTTFEVPLEIKEAIEKIIPGI